LNLRYFEISRAGRTVFDLLRRMRFIAGTELDFSCVDVRWPDGSFAVLRIDTTEMTAVCRAVRLAAFEGNPLIAWFQQRFHRSRVLVFLEKCLAEELAPTLLWVNVVSWSQRTRAQGLCDPAIFFIARTPWHQQLKEYAKRQGVTLGGYGFSWPMPKIQVWNLWRIGILMARRLVTGRMPVKTFAETPLRPSSADGQAGPAHTIGVAYHGKGVTFDPSKNSDLFWIPFAKLQPGQCMAYLLGPEDPLDEEKFAALQQASIRAVAKNESASRSSRVPVWGRDTDILGLLLEFMQVVTLVARAMATGWTHLGANLWIASKSLYFVSRYKDWRRFFANFNVKLTVDYSDWDKDRLPANQAIADLGGLSVSYQLADESTAAVLRARAVDVHFSFSPTLAETERQSGSDIDQFVAVGYVHDHAFSPVRCRASQLRRRLTDRGARFIISFFDENSGSDKRKLVSHEYRAENYRYLLAKLFTEPDLGLIFKPKKPMTLRQRLGPVAGMLDKALATGRCFVFEEGILATPVLPCEASQAADVAIGLLSGTTTALESALAGTPALLLDREGLPFHPLYALGEGRVVFQDWDSLWEVLSAYRNDPVLAPGFGDWSPVLHRMDPFRDGKAAARIGTYISWLAEGLAQGLSREEAMERARQRYVAIWGSDKVIDLSVKARSERLRDSIAKYPLEAGERA
jgi:hypothetical protein